MHAELKGGPRYITGWLSAEAAAPLLKWSVQGRTGVTELIRPLTESQRQQVLELLGVSGPARRQAEAAHELRLTARRNGWHVALGPLQDDA